LFVCFTFGPDNFPRYDRKPEEIPTWCLRSANHIPLLYTCVLYRIEHLSVPPRILEIYSSSLQPGNSLIHTFHQLLSVWGRHFCLFVCLFYFWAR
jgi:hypothetical protein